MAEDERSLGMNNDWYRDQQGCVISNYQRSGDDEFVFKQPQQLSEAEMKQFVKDHAQDNCWPIPFNAQISSIKVDVFWGSKRGKMQKVKRSPKEQAVVDRERAKSRDKRLMRF